MKSVKIILALFASLLMNSLPARADDVCVLPAKIDDPVLVNVDCQNIIKPQSYLLSLAWSPEHCLKPGRKDDFQCKLNNFSFVVHGLWGENDSAQSQCQQPRHCAASLVEKSTIVRTLCTVPGVQLIQGEWQKHGTCTDFSSEMYFAKIRELWGSVNKPDILKLVDEKDQTTSGAIVKAFVNENSQSGIFPEAVSIESDMASRLSEVHICYDLHFKYKACTSKGAPPEKTILVTRPRKN